MRPGTPLCHSSVEDSGLGRGCAREECGIALRHFCYFVEIYVTPNWRVWTLQCAFPDNFKFMDNLVCLSCVVVAGGNWVI